MRRTPAIFIVCAALLTPASFPLHAQSVGRSVCDYFPTESRIEDLSLQGWFSFYDGPYADDRERASSADLIMEYSRLYSSAALGHSLDARVEARGTLNDWLLELTGSGSLRRHLEDRFFLVGGLSTDGAWADRWEADLTGGVGTGRFRDVTPLAQAIRVQNSLLDLGELLAPVGEEVLLELAQILGDVSFTDDEKTIALSDRLLETDLTVGDQLSVRGLLVIEQIIGSEDQTRLCGRDIQARLGATLRLVPEWSLAATGIIHGRYAAVPDPISQIDAAAEMRVRLGHPNEFRVDSDVSYTRRLPGNWRLRAEYRLGIDRMWTDPEQTSVVHRLSGSLSTELFNSIGLSVSGDLEHRTGDEEISFSLAVQLEADLL